DIRTRQLEMKAILSYLEDGKSILEVGCGNGFVAEEISRNLDVDIHAIDFSKDMALVAVAQDMGGEQIVGVAHYYLNQATNYAEVSFLVRDDWQAKGIGTYLLEILTDIARKRGILGFEARVLASNHSMLAIFYNSGYKITTRKEENTYFIMYEFKNKV
ncbi:MAG: GNAT family N-acetyltransferase, partial [Chitinispirillaceae bacterium]|nr:GNAT family N-acetyltransferase [Chitinispirillaceae bacterium]